MTDGDAAAGDGRIYDVNRIMEILPHRPPLLLVDRVVAVEPWRSLRAFKNVTIADDFFRGHFPGNPVMPGVLILEAMAQASLLLLGLSLREHPDLRPPEVTITELSGRVGYFASCDKVKFRRRVVPGDRLDLRVSTLRLGSRALRMAGEASVDGQRTAQAEMTATI
jgi:3-hydroxyacyl-[acyl-carrier-protein] dehydratase